MSAPEMAARALDSELKVGAPSAALFGQQPVNDLTGAVKKKKKPVEAQVASSASAEKRKADEEGVSPMEKKARLEDSS